ncbi:hypothetical protein NDU88_000540 [Pleurodeles waltl]|uniref:Uncharacterized protein n=1 Tax=Pleurodeles waltl TaxID=8319 RepID=A0AAV7M5K5_PLEWA|nr:hypothetical protein NDU88_000540 [Pleurodeles waltl]
MQAAGPVPAGTDAEQAASGRMPAAGDTAEQAVMLCAGGQRRQPRVGYRQRGPVSAGTGGEQAVMLGAGGQRRQPRVGCRQRGPVSAGTGGEQGVMLGAGGQRRQPRVGCRQRGPVSAGTGGEQAVMLGAGGQRRQPRVGCRQRGPVPAGTDAEQAASGRMQAAGACPCRHRCRAGSLGSDTGSGGLYLQVQMESRQPRLGWRQRRLSAGTDAEQAVMLGAGGSTSTLGSDAGSGGLYLQAQMQSRQPRVGYRQRGPVSTGTGGEQAVMLGAGGSTSTLGSDAGSGGLCLQAQVESRQ